MGVLTYFLISPLYDSALTTASMQPGYIAVEGDKQSGRDGAGSRYGVGDEAVFDWEHYRVEIHLYFFGLDSDLSYHFGNNEEEFFEEV